MSVPAEVILLTTVVIRTCLYETWLWSGTADGEECSLVHSTPGGGQRI